MTGRNAFQREWDSWRFTAKFCTIGAMGYAKFALFCASDGTVPYHITEILFAIYRNIVLSFFIVRRCSFGFRSTMVDCRSCQSGSHGHNDFILQPGCCSQLFNTDYHRLNRILPPKLFVHSFPFPLKLQIEYIYLHEYSSNVRLFSAIPLYSSRYGFRL